MDVSTEKRVEICDRHGSFESCAIKFRTKVFHWTKCPVCGKLEAEKVEVEKAEAEVADRQRRLEARIDSAGIPLRFRSKSFASYVADTDGQTRARLTAEEIAENFHKHRKAGTFAVFSGLPGTGKTHLAISVLQAVMKTHTVLYTSAIDVVRAIRNTWRKDSDKTETQVLQILASIDLLAIDEIGVQYGTDAEQLILFDIIDKRYRNMMPTILITNLNATGIKEFLGERTYDRLREAGVWLAFDWESARGRRPTRLT